MISRTGTGGRVVPILTVAGFVASCLGGFVLLYSKSGGDLPWTANGYRVAFVTTDTKNLVTNGEIRVAGVVVGSVESTKVEGGEARVVVSLDPDVAPLHEGVKVRIGMKSILGQSFLDVVDGKGTEIPDGATLPPSASVPAVDVDEVLDTFDAKTKKSLGGLLTKLGPATQGRRDDVSALMTGLGSIGREGHVAVNALVEQGDSLKALIREVDVILAAVDTGQGDIADVVRSAHQLTRATAAQAPALESTIRQLPSLMKNARGATGALKGLTGDLGPVAADLKTAAPDLNSALVDLPATTEDLRGLLPTLDITLARAPATLKEVPALASDVSAAVPEVNDVLDELTPMLEYIRPYGRDVGSFFGNFGATFERPMENGVRPVSLAPIFNEYSLRGNPLKLTELNPLHWSNPYPEPGAADKPAPFKGQYPRVERFN